MKLNPMIMFNVSMWPRGMLAVKSSFNLITIINAPLSLTRHATTPASPRSCHQCSGPG